MPFRPLGSSERDRGAKGTTIPPYLGPGPRDTLRNSYLGQGNPAIPAAAAEATASRAKMVSHVRLMRSPLLLLVPLALSRGGWYCRC
jgi:hypothetical protein